MGCAASRLDNEDVVRRCKERRRLVKGAVQARHLLAETNSEYCFSLRVTGAALCAFAAGELLSVPDETRPSSSTPPAQILSSAASIPRCVSKASVFRPSPARTVLSRSTVKPIRRHRRLPKLPHILSESSPCSSAGNQFCHNYEHQQGYGTETIHSRSPSETSSAWNWDNFRPPSPPDSDFFDRKAQFQSANVPQHHLDHPDADDEETENERWEYDFFDPGITRSDRCRIDKYGCRDQKTEGQNHRQGELCSNCGDRDHYSVTSSSDGDNECRPEIEARCPAGWTVRPESVKSERQQSHYSDSRGVDKTGSEGFDMKLVVRHSDLKEIATAIKELFDKAADSGKQVNEMLEFGRAPLDRSFRQLKKTVYHSTGMLSNLSSSWTSKPPLAIKYMFDDSSLKEAGASGGLLSTMEKLLAWEKKLYEEVKAREAVKIERDRKLSTLQNQEFKGEAEAKLNKTRSSIKKLQSLFLVTSQAVTTTSAAINQLKTTKLIPQLVELSHGFMYMWKSMEKQHERQSEIVQQVRELVSRSTSGDATSEQHRQSTRALEIAVSRWHANFCLMVKHERDLIRSLHGWYRLALLSVRNEDLIPPVAVDDGDRHPGVNLFLDEWRLALDRVPDTVASEAIKSFVNVVHAIYVKQSEEMKTKKRAEAASKELQRKSMTIQNLERRFYQSYSSVGSFPDFKSDAGGPVLDAGDPLSEKKSELMACRRRVEDEMLRHSKAVEVTRAMTLNHIQSGLPGLFQAIASFSALFSEALEAVCNRSYQIK